MMAGKRLLKWHDEAMAFGRRYGSFVAINPRDNPISWGEWRRYFLEHFGRLPYVFTEVERGTYRSWTAPIDNPSSYRP